VLDEHFAAKRKKCYNRFMNKLKNYLFILIIFILAFLAANFVFPQFLNIAHIPNIPFRLGLDLQGGAHLVYQADLSGIKLVDRTRAMEGLRDIIERRIDVFGVVEPRVEVQYERLIVELAGVFDVAEAIRIIGKTPFLEFKEMDPSEQFFVSTPLTGKYLLRSQVTFAHPAPEPVISLQFNQEGAKLFEEITARNIGKPLAIYIDGMMISAPIVREKIVGGQAQISGGFTIIQAQELSRNLNIGALPVPIELISQQTVGPALGKVSLEKSLIAGIFGLLAVAIFLILFYRLLGILAVLTLGIYVVLLLSLFKLIPITLTLAGIAGFIFSIGIAVDANILIFSRMREEIKAGKSIKTSIEEGIRRAWPSIRDGNLTTLMVTLVLFFFGVSFVKGFALTLFLGILVSMFSAIVITKIFLRFFGETKLAELKWLWK
jgi:protein-export SecD/SecF family membrane protein